MLSLYTLIGVMLLCAVILLAIPFLTQRMFFSIPFLSLFLFIVTFSLCFYQMSGDKTALMQWLMVGKQHYVLLEQFDKLGGVDGAISKIEQKLSEDPKDAQGWRILGKLYMAKAETKKAAAALEKASELEKVSS